MSSLTITRIPQFLDPWFAEIEQIWDEIEASTNDQESRIITLESAIISDVVTSLSKSGDPQLQGDITLSSTGTITLTQAGQNIAIGGGGVTDHGALTGLADDDHLQYLLTNGSRALTGAMSFGNFQISNFKLENVSSDPTAGNQGRLVYNTISNLVKVDNGSSFIPVGVSDHGSLTGLLDDDHPQYLLTDGTRAVTGDFTVNGLYKNETNESWSAQSQEDNGALSVGFVFDTLNNLSTSGSKVFSIRNATNEYLSIRRGTDLLGNTSSTLLDLYNISGSKLLEISNTATNSSINSKATDELDISHASDYSLGAGYKFNKLVSDLSTSEPSIELSSLKDGVGNSSIKAFGGLDGIALQIVDTAGSAGTSELLLKNQDLSTLGRTDVRWKVALGETGFENYLGLTSDGTFIGGNNDVGSTKWRFESGAEDGASTIAYELDTLNDLTLGPPQLHTSWKVQGVEIMSLDPSGNLTLAGTLTGSVNTAVTRVATAVSITTSGQTITGVTDTSAPRTITLATADTIDGKIMYIKDESGGAGTNNITIDTEGSELIDGVASITITVNYGVLKVYSDGTNWFTL